MRCVPQEVKDLYHLLEQEVLPLELESKVQPLLAKISSIGGRLASASSVPEVHLAKYVPALEKLATLRVLQQVFLNPFVLLISLAVDFSYLFGLCNSGL